MLRSKTRTPFVFHGQRVTCPPARARKPAKGHSRHMQLKQAPAKGQIRLLGSANQSFGGRFKETGRVLPGWRLQQQQQRRLKCLALTEVKQTNHGAPRIAWPGPSKAPNIADPLGRNGSVILGMLTGRIHKSRPAKEACPWDPRQKASGVCSLRPDSCKLLSASQASLGFAGFARLCVEHILSADTYKYSYPCMLCYIYVYREIHECMHQFLGMCSRTCQCHRKWYCTSLALKHPPGVAWCGFPADRATELRRP